MTGERILAAGGMLWRPVATGIELCLVHRPRYDDWSLPKGKLHTGELPLAAAVREVTEETGVHPVVGRRLPTQRYELGPDRKYVDYWAMTPADGTFVATDEVDSLRWVTPALAATTLTYDRDRNLVATFAAEPVPTAMVLLVRHAKAGSRDRWDGDDELRPLSESGQRQARELAGLLRLYGPDRISTAPPLRCRDTVVPLADALGLPIVDEPLLSEGLFAEDPDAALVRVRELAALPGVTVASSQGAVIPEAVAALARDAALPVAVDPDDVPSKKASTWVLGSRDGKLVSADYVERPGD